jgi:hypothetical protein
MKSANWLGVGLALAGMACGTTEHNAGAGAGAGAGGTDTGGAATGGVSGSAGSVPPNDGVYVIEFSEPDQRDGKPGLLITNSTLAIALTRGPAVRQFSPAPPGDVTPADVVVHYTRIGCSIDDPDSWIGGAALTPAPSTQLMRVTVTEHEDLDGVTNALQLVDQTCLSVRQAEGGYQRLIQYDTLQPGDRSMEATFEVQAPSVDAFALFLPTRTRISRVSYTLPVP